MANALAHENSPYLLQHANNPVDWRPWGPEALNRAQAEDKPIFLSIGYAACHWCHVMAHESFEDPATAALMNKHFINIKVDREERPDIDGIYMDAVVAMTGQGGWPLSVFLTPDGKPFFGGTYFPPMRRYQMPSFREVLETVAQLWQNDRQELLRSAQEAAEHLTHAAPASVGELDPVKLDQAAKRLSQAYDWQHGGWGGAPKFPQPMAINFLLQRARRGDALALDIAVHALESMGRGGMYDVVGGGFARYSTDDDWLIPHFEKMLYDNAQLALAYLHAYLLTQRSDFKRICTETLDFVARELLDSSGGFYSSLDADSEGHEGKFYVWGADELRSALTAAQARAPLACPKVDWPGFFFAAYDVTPGGNFEGRTVLQRALDDQSLAEAFGLTSAQVQELLRYMHAALLETRSARVRPGADDKVLTAWNGLMLTAFAEAAAYLRRPDYLEIARRNAAFLLRALYPQGRLLRSWRHGSAGHDAYLEDHAALILGLLTLYRADFDLQWFDAALGLSDDMLSQFQDSAYGFFDTRSDAAPLLLRPKDVQDNATPSGNALAALALLELSAYTGREDWRAYAEKMLAAVQDIAARYPTGLGQWLVAFDRAVNPAAEVALLTPGLDHPGFDAWIQALWAAWRPGLALAGGIYPPPLNAPALLANRPLIDDLPTAYVCRRFICLRPTTQLDEAIHQIDQSSPSAPGPAI